MARYSKAANAAEDAELARHVRKSPFRPEQEQASPAADSSQRLSCPEAACGRQFIDTPVNGVTKEQHLQAHLVKGHPAPAGKGQPSSIMVAVSAQARFVGSENYVRHIVDTIASEIESGQEVKVTVKAVQARWSVGRTIASAAVKALRESHDLPSRKVAHGTPQGYAKHVRLKEAEWDWPACPPCTEAASAARLARMKADQAA